MIITEEKWRKNRQSKSWLWIRDAIKTLTGGHWLWFTVINDHRHTMRHDGMIAICEAPLPIQTIPKLWILLYRDHGVPRGHRPALADGKPSAAGATQRAERITGMALDALG
jgi:hypothetical protein